MKNEVLTQKPNGHTKDAVIRAKLVAGKQNGAKQCKSFQCEQGVSGSRLFFLFFLPHLYSPCDVPSLLLRPKLSDFPPKPQNHQTWQITVNLPNSTGLLKIYNKPPTLVELHMIKCLGKEVSHNSSYCEISPLASSPAKLLAKAHSSKVLLRNKPLLSLSPFPQPP